MSTPNTNIDQLARINRLLNDAKVPNVGTVADRVAWLANRYQAVVLAGQNFFDGLQTKKLQKFLERP